MSGIIGLALRMSAVRALSGATLAGDRVFDSAIIPLDRLLSDTPAPFINVSAEDESSTPAGRDLNTGDREIDLLIEAGLSTATALEDGSGVAVSIPETDAGLELSLSILGRQINGVLFGRGGGAWGDVFRGLTTSIKAVTSRRGADGDKGARIAARQTVYRVAAIAEPAFAPALADTPLAAFLAALAADPVTKPLEPAIRAAIEGVPQDWPEVYTAAAVAAGLTEDEAARIGIATGSPLTTVSMSDGFVGDAQAVADQLPGGDG